ncbi:hypothetical protein, partial [Acinetobacter ursingii]|uniref:hypothetical protein n=1 Tax=Acinetobacter ursingii TaxID=108980 RepID=UPI00397795A7
TKIYVMTDLFLNGVCRHELTLCFICFFSFFLNGVCRHEHTPMFANAANVFLNGVCRHELFLSLKRSLDGVSKWRMPP